MSPELVWVTRATCTILDTWIFLTERVQGGLYKESTGSAKPSARFRYTRTGVDTCTSIHVHRLYTRVHIIYMHALTLRTYVRVTEGYTEKCTGDKMADLTAVSK